MKPEELEIGDLALPRPEVLHIIWKKHPHPNFLRSFFFDSEESPFTRIGIGYLYKKISWRGHRRYCAHYKVIK